MKLSSAIAFLTAVASVSAKDWDLCCCHQNHICHDPSTRGVVNKSNEFGKPFHMTVSYYSKQYDGAPFTCTGCYAYHEGAKISGKEMHKMCKTYGVPGFGGSMCFNRKRNPDTRW
ncbi:hypothetical protein FKW77_004197 [Venturia effusa]|uniref:Uncharacterized protein n=1 Tax=Venturia effusa TaxID=50376 RepID=A0A517LK19_9PEZI|nr:hypothetical protein FKW77_004197 [Venturia effusa]